MPESGELARGSGFDEMLKGLPRWAIPTLGALMIAGLSLIDYATGSEISFSVFYLAPVLFVTWYAGLGLGVAIAVVSALTWGVIDVAAGAHYSSWWIPVWNSAVRLAFFVTALALLDRLAASNRAMSDLALTDALTGLSNARDFYRELEREIARVRRHGDVFALAYIDLDHFKLLNDAHGHEAGDRLLRAIARAMQATGRTSDVLARLGGDEFGVLMPATDEVAAFAAMTRVSEAITTTVRATAPDLPGLGATIGMAVFGEPPASADAAVRAADRAMYEGKSLGRGVIRVAGAEASTAL